MAMENARPWPKSRKVAAILVADIVGYSPLTAADEEGTLARLRALRNDFIDPTIAAHNGRLVKRTGDGAIIEFRSVVEAVRCAIEVRNGFTERDAGLPDGQRIVARVGIHLGDVVEEADGDLMGDGVNIAARLEGICDPGAIALSEDAYRQVRDKIDETFVDLGEQNLKNIARPMRIYALTAAPAAGGPATVPKSPDSRERRSALTPILDNIVIPRIVGKSRSRGSAGTRWRRRSPRSSGTSRARKAPTSRGRRRKRAPLSDLPARSRPSTRDRAIGGCVGFSSSRRFSRFWRRGRFAGRSRLRRHIRPPLFP